MPRLPWPILSLIVLICSGMSAHGGLYYSGEVWAELPSGWRGFLLDHRALRLAAVPATARRSASPLRLEYEKSAGRLEKLSRERKLSADEQADLGALYV